MSVYYIYVWADCVKSNLKFRPEKTGIISISLTLACSILKSLFRFNLTCYTVCHDENGWCQIPINSFLLEVKAEGV